MREQFREMSKVFEEDTDLLVRRGDYPYDYMDSFERFSELELPPIEEFYSLLNDSNISNKAYEHARELWKHFNIKNMSKYHDIHLNTDAILSIS